MESYGGVGAEAVKFIRMVAKLSDEPARMFERSIDMLAVALAKGNRMLEHVGVPKVLQANHGRRACLARTHLPLAAEITSGA